MLKRGKDGNAAPNYETEEVAQQDLGKKSHSHCRSVELEKPRSGPHGIQAQFRTTALTIPEASEVNLSTHFKAAFPDSFTREAIHTESVHTEETIHTGKGSDYR